MRFIILALMAAISFLVVLPLTSATTDEVTADYAGCYAFGANTIYAMPITASASGVLDSTAVRVTYVGSGGYIQMAIYDNTADPDRVRLGVSSGQLAADGWNTLALAGVTITEGNVYYVAFDNNDAAIKVCAKSTIASKYRTYAYGSFPNPLGSVTADWSINVKMTYSAPPVTNFTQVNGIVANASYPNPYTISCTGNTACKLWQNNTDITAKNNTKLDLAIGEYNFTASITNNRTTVWYLINAGSTSLSFTGISNHTNATKDRPLVLNNISSNLYLNHTVANLFNSTNIGLDASYNVWVGNGTDTHNYTLNSVTIEQNITAYAAPPAQSTYCQGLDKELDFCQLSDGTKQIVLHTDTAPSYSVIITL